MTGKLSGSKKKWFFKLLTFVSYFFFSLWLKTQCNGSHYHYFCGKVINGSLWFLVNVVSLCTVLFYFTVVTWLWSPFLFLINKLSNLPVLFLSSTTSYSQSAFTATYLLMCTVSLIFAAWSLDVCCQIKSGPKKWRKWNVVQMRWHSQDIQYTHSSAQKYLWNRVIIVYYLVVVLGDASQCFPQKQKPFLIDKKRSDWHKTG